VVCLFSLIDIYGCEGSRVSNHGLFVDYACLTVYVLGVLADGANGCLLDCLIDTYVWVLCGSSSMVC